MPRLIPSLLLSLLALALALPAAAQRAPDALGKVKAAKTLNVAFSADSLPFSYVGGGNRPEGYSIDLCQRVIAAIAKAAETPDLKVNWLPGSAAERVQMVASGKADLDCANTTATQTRMKDVDFSNLVFVDGGGFLVGASAPLNRFADLDGKKIAVIKGTTTEQRLAQALRVRKVNATVVPVADGNEGMAQLEAGSVAAYAGDKIKLIGLAAQAKDPAKLAMLGEDLSFEPLAFAVPRSDSAFRLVVNRALTDVYVTADIEAIFGKWFGKLGRPSGLLAAMYLLAAVPD